MPTSLAEKPVRFAEDRGGHVRSDSQGVQAQPIGLSCHDLNVVGKFLKWETKSSYYFRSSSHVNLQETRASFREIRHMSKQRNPTHHQELLCLVDSEVALGAISKGRSSSFKLNGILRGVIGYLVCFDISLKLVLIPSGSNPADAPRCLEEQKAREETPPWLASHLEPLVDDI